MFDLLSIADYQGVREQQTDFVILNSTVFTQKVNSISKGYTTVELYLDNDSNGKSATKTLMEHRGAKNMSGIYKGHKDMNDWLVMNTENGLGQEAQDVFLLPQKQTCFTPDGRKEEIK